MKKISIIIPVYNIAPYIERCITSIINQEPSDLEAEIILVDDGSTDESGSICYKISEEHHNVSVIHQQNAGQSDARNNGLKKATGDYIWFVDGDDYAIDKNNAKIYLVGLVFGGHIEALNHIMSWQIQQDIPGKLTIKIVKTPSYTLEIENQIIEFFSNNNFDICIIYADSIEKTQRGKQPFMIQNIKS